MRNAVYKKMRVIATIKEIETAAKNNLPFDLRLTDSIIGKVFGLSDYYTLHEVEEIISKLKELQSVYNKLIYESDSDLVHSRNLQHCRSSLSITISTLENIKLIIRKIK